MAASVKEGGMSITVELPADMEQRVRDIPDLNKRIVNFLRDQADWEEWRRRRYSAQAQTIALESLAEAEALKVQGVSREEMFREFFEVHDRIARLL